jgi:hypothetical protein
LTIPLVATAADITRRMRVNPAPAARPDRSAVEYPKSWDQIRSISRVVAAIRRASALSRMAALPATDALRWS